MSLDELLRAIEDLSPDDLRRLREYLEERTYRLSETTQAGALEEALSALRDGLTDKQLDQLEWAMNVETVQPPEKTAWQE